MDDFPEFMKNPANAIATDFQSKGVEGFVFDGAGKSQVAYWSCHIDGESAEHVHDYEEYMVVVQGSYTVIMPEGEFELTAGREFYIPAHIPHAGRFCAHTRTIHAFGGRRAERVKKKKPRAEE